jgi:hypothetical protein
MDGLLTAITFVVAVFMTGFLFGLWITARWVGQAIGREVRAGHLTKEQGLDVANLRGEVRHFRA